MTPWTIAHQVPLSIEFSRQEYWSGLPCPPPGDLVTQGSNPGLLQCRWILYQLSQQGSLNPADSKWNPMLRAAVLVTQSCWMLCNCIPPSLFCPWNSPVKNTRVGSHSLLQRVFPTQGSNPRLLLCRQILYRLSHQGSLRAAVPGHSVQINSSHTGILTLCCPTEISKPAAVIGRLEGGPTISVAWC